MKLSDYINNKPVLHTDRLTLRTLQPLDADDLRQWLSQKEIYRYWGKPAGKADKDPSLLFAKPAKPTKSFHWGIVENASHKVVGEMWVYLIEGDRMAKLAIRLAPSCHGKGLATEATREVVRFCFEETELRRLWTDVDVRNTASVRVLEKSGFQREGLIRQGKMVSTWCDYYIYGAIKS